MSIPNFHSHLQEIWQQGLRGWGSVGWPHGFLKSSVIPKALSSPIWDPNALERQGNLWKAAVPAGKIRWALG